MMRRWSLCLLLLGLCALPARRAFSEDLPADPSPPKLRLPGDVRPTREAVSLEVVPDSETFAGEATIEVELAKATSFLWLNGTELKVSEATVTSAGKTHDARVVPGGEDFLGLGLDSPVGPGSATLHFVYGGRITRRETEGVFAQQEGDDWYAITQFESTSARHAFPCFDEPSYKIPWRVTLKVKREHRAVSNTPVSEERDAPNGMKTVAFAETRPLPSYLVAFAVGPFDVADAGTAGRNKIPVRIYTPKGRTAWAAWAVQSTPKILEKIERYFDMPYPYEKLDEVTIPLSRFAMENPGMITYSQRMLLREPGQDTPRSRRGYVSVCAHEIAHQWFGDLVTLAWWDDTWLNESFANWLGRKTTDGFDPKWNVKIAMAEARSKALASDMLATARKIRQPIVSNDDIENAFDSITYGKGEAVLEMFESYLGEQTFRKAVQRYLREHAWKNATAADFVGAVTAEAGRDMSAPFSSFLDQTGAPTVRAELSCPKDGPPRIALSQAPFRPLGSSDAKVAELWKLPVCVAYGRGGSRRRACTMLTEATGSLALPKGTPCPDWIFPNADVSGYYFSDPASELKGKMLSAEGPLTLPERVGVLSDLGVQMTSGAVTQTDVLPRLPELAADRSIAIVRKAIERVRAIDEFVADAQRPKFASFVQGLFGDRARSLGWDPKPDEDDDVTLLRPTLLETVGVQGEDKQLAKQAAVRVARWLDGKDPDVDPDLIDTALTLAARDGDEALFNRIAGAARSATDRTRRRLMLSALGSFRTPKLVSQALALSLDPAFDPREAREIPAAMREDPVNRQAAYDFLKEHFDAITSKLPRGSGAGLMSSSAFFCDHEHAKDVKDFFGPKVSGLPGGPRILDQVIERIDLCAVRREVIAPNLAEFLQNYGSSKIAAK